MSHSGPHSTPATNAVIVLFVIGAASVLCYFDKVSGDALVGLLSGVLGAVIGVQAHAAGTRAGVKAVTDPPPDS